MSKRNRTAVNYARRAMTDARDLLSEAIRTLESQAGPGDPDEVQLVLDRLVPTLRPRNSVPEKGDSSE